MPNTLNPISKKTFDVVISTPDNDDIYSSAFFEGEFLSSSEMDYSGNDTVINGALVKERIRFFREGGVLKGEISYRPDAPYEELDEDADFTYNTDIELTFDEESGELDQMDDFGGSETFAYIYIYEGADVENVIEPEYADDIFDLGTVDIEGKPHTVRIVVTLD